MDYDYLLNIKVKYHLSFIFVIVILIITLIYVVNLKIYDTYNCLGVYNENIIYLNIPIEYSDTIINGDYLKINKESYDYAIIDISEIKFDNNMINYQTYSLKIDKVFMENEVVNIMIYSNKEKIYYKIKELI